MKLKGILIAGLALTMVCGAVVIASAATYHTCTVNKASTTSGVTNIALSGLPNQTTNAQWCTVAAASNDTALAVALTSMSLGMPVRVGLASDYVPNTKTTAGTCNLTQIGLEN